MRYDHIVLDLDGTVTNPFVGITGSYRYALAQVGRPVPDDVDLSWVIGPGIADNLDRLGVPPSEVDAVVAAYRERHTAIGLYQAVLIPGIEALLAALVDAGATLALATAKPESQGVETLVHFGLDAHFAVIGGIRQPVTRTKGEVVADVLERVGVTDRARAVMIGDRRHDIEGAHENGLVAIGVGWGFAADGELEAAGADHVVESIDELRALLLA